MTGGEMGRAGVRPREARVTVKGTQKEEEGKGARPDPEIRRKKGPLRIWWSRT